MGRRFFWAFAAMLFAAGGAPASLANPRSEALRARASNELYNLDRERAIATFREAIAADPEDASAYLGLAVALWMGETFRRGTMTVDSYLGGITRSNVKLPPPPPELVSEFQQITGHAIELAEQKVEANPRDPDAHYQLGAAIGLRASFAASVQGSVRAAFGSARDAYKAHERVLELDPRRHDAGLVVGTYRYIVAAMALPLRWVAYVAGFGGGKERGISLVQGAADFAGGENRTDARIALLLLYNREKRYDDALRELEHLRMAFPRNRLFWLETGSTLLRAGRHAEADRVLTEGIEKLAADTRPRMFGEEALWFQKRGAARGALGRADAKADLERSLAAEGRRWVHGRARLELARLAQKAGHTAAAEREAKLAAALCEGDNDKPCANEAKRLAR